MPYQSVFRPGLFAGQTLIVTGGGTGIGRAIAHELASLGARPVLAGRRKEPLEWVQAELQAEGHAATIHPLDIRDEAAVQSFYERVLEERGELHGLVNNAGGQYLSPAESISHKGWQAVLDTNLTGTFLMCREAFKAGLGARGGAIVNVVSEMWRGFPGMAHSGAARAAVVNLTQTLAVEWARVGIRVNAVAPGTIDSSGLANYGEMGQAILQEVKKDIPMQRLGTEAEVAAAVTFLLSPAAAYVSGETFRVDGASSLWRKTWSIEPHQRFPLFEGFSGGTPAHEAGGGA